MVVSYPVPAPDRTAARPREIVLGIFDRVNAGSWFHYQSAPGTDNLIQLFNPEEALILRPFEQFFRQVTNAIPQFRLNIAALSERADRVMVRYTVTGVQEGAIMGIAPSKQTITIDNMGIFTVDHGRIVKYQDGGHQINQINH